MKKVKHILKRNVVMYVNTATTLGDECRMKTLTEVIKVLDRWMESPDTELTPETIFAAWEYLKSYQNLLKLVPSLVAKVEQNTKKGKTIG